MKTPRLLTLLAALLSTMTAWADNYNVGTDSELRAAIANDGANITVTADIALSNSTLSIERTLTMTGGRIATKFLFKILFGIT